MPRSSPQNELTPPPLLSSPDSGMIVFSSSARILHMNGPARTLMALFGKSHELWPQMAPESMPSILTEFCYDVLAQHQRRIEAQDWAQFEMRRICHMVTPSLLLTGPPPPATYLPRQELIRVPYVDDEDDAESERSQLASLLMTLVWYAVPIGLYLLWALALGGSADPNCVDGAGNPCPAPRDAAMTTMVDSAPRLATALALSLMVAIVIRWITGAWKATTVGFASSVVGAGIATVIFSVLSRTGTV